MPKAICVVPQLTGVGGMVSFRARFTQSLSQRGYHVHHDLRQPAEAVLVIGGTRDLPGLWGARRRGARLVQRLNGMNWLHRKLATGLRHYLRAEYGNLILRVIRGRLAQHIVYQSEFSQSWWESRHGPTPGGHRVVYNGVDLGAYSPRGPQQPPHDAWRLLMVEGSLMGGYEQGLAVAVNLAAGLVLRQASKPVELMVVGRTPQAVRQKWEAHAARSAGFRFNWMGQVGREQIPAIDRAAHLLYSADINAACPNSVIEALACGLPVLAYDTGALPEMVTPQAGRIAPYGGDPWQLDPPDTSALIDSALALLDAQADFRRGARARAEAAFDLETMVDGYLEALLG